MMHHKPQRNNKKSEIYREAEEAGPQLRLPVIEELRLSLHQSREEITMAILILAPVLKVLEDGIALILGVLLEVPVYGNVSPVSNLLRQVCCIEDELRLEESVLSGLCKEPQIQSQIEVRQSFIQKPGDKFQ